MRGSTCGISRADAKFVHVVYKGGAQAATDLIAARIDFGSFAAGSVIQFVKEGQLKPLGVIAERRSALLPEVATTAEQGLPGLDAGVHFMLYAPAATPREVVAVLNAELNKIVGDATLKQRFAGWTAYLFSGDMRLPKLLGLKVAN